MSLDVFKGRAFNAIELTEHVRKAPHAPDRLGNAGIFTTKGVRTRDIWISTKDGTLNLIPTTPIGAPLPQYENDLREARAFRSTRVAKGDRIMAEEIQGVLADESESQLKTMQAEVDLRLTGLQRDMELTREHMRLGAIDGKILDADGTTVIYDYFAEFGQSRPAEVNFNLATATLSTLALNCVQIKQAMFYASRGAWLTGRTSVRAFCGYDFWQQLVTHAEVVELYKSASQVAAALGRDVESFQMHGITFEQYWGTEDDTTVAIAADKCRFVPTNTNGAFQEIYSPAEFAPYVNRAGMREYAMTIPDSQRQAFVDVELYSYPLVMCSRPEMLQTGTAA